MLEAYAETKVGDEINFNNLYKYKLLRDLEDIKAETDGLILED